MTKIACCPNCGSLDIKKSEKQDESQEEAFHCVDCLCDIYPLFFEAKEKYLRFAKGMEDRNELGRRSLAETAEKFKGLAKEYFSVDLKFDLESVAKLDLVAEGALHLAKKDARVSDMRVWTQSIGAFLGEALRHMYGGQWFFHRSRKDWKLLLRREKHVSTGEVWPIELARKRLARETSLELFAKVLDGAVKKYGEQNEADKR